MNNLWLQILNCVCDGLGEDTWFTEGRKFTLDYVCMDGRGLKKDVSASVADRGKVIESVHTVITVEIEWKGVLRSRKKKNKRKKEYRNIVR